MDWLLLATGWTGGMTLMFCVRWLRQWLYPEPELHSHFSPKGGCADRIIAELGRARHEILVLAYSFSSKPIAEALIAAAKRGVRVEVILDRSNEHETYSDLAVLLEGGLQPLIDDHHAIAHNKVMLIDGRTLITGSFNFTHQAEVENAENLLVIRHLPDLLMSYRGDFEHHKSHARAPQTGAAPQAPSGHQHRQHAA